MGTPLGNRKTALAFLYASYSEFVILTIYDYVLISAWKEINKKQRKTKRRAKNIWSREKDELFASVFPELLAAMNGEIRRSRGFRDCAQRLFVYPPLCRGFRSQFLVWFLALKSQILWVMEQRICRAALDLALVFCMLLVSTGAATEESRRPSAGELILGSSDLCFPMDSPVAGTVFQGVLEVGD